MELEDLPWPGELEEEAEEGEEAENLDQDEVAVVMEEKEGEGRRKLASDLHCESRPLGSPDGEDDEEAKAWMRARPAGTVVPPSLPTFHRSEDQRPGPEKKTESWHRLPQEMDFSNTLDTTQTRFNRREEGTKVTDFPSLEEGLLTLSENRVKEPNRDLLCSPLLEGLQGKAESDICTLDDDSECCSLDENAVVCGNRVAELQREICVQGDLTGECIELAGLENLLDDLEICDSSLQLSSKEENSSEEPPTRKTEYHTSDLRMLRISPDSVPETLKHLPGVTSKGGISEIIQSKLKAGINTTPADSDTGSHLSFSSEDFPHLAVRSLQENTIGQLTDALNQQALADSQPTEGTLKVSAVHEIADQKTGISTVLSSSYSQRGKPSIFYPQASPYSRLAEEALKVSSAPGSAEQKTGIPIVSPTSYSFREKRGIFYRETWSDSHLTEQAEKASAAPGSAEQNTGISTTTSASYPHRERPSVLYQQQLPDSHLAGQAQTDSTVSGFADQKTGVPKETSTSYPHRERPSVSYQQELPDSHLAGQAQTGSAVPGFAEQKTGVLTATSTSYPHREKPSIFYEQEFPDSHLFEHAQKGSAVPGFAEQKMGVPTATSVSYPHREKPSVFSEQELPDSHLAGQAQMDSTVSGFAEQKTGVPTETSTTYPHRERTSVPYQQELPDSHLAEQAQTSSAITGFAEQKTGVPTATSTFYPHREKPSVFYEQEFPGSHVAEQAQKGSAVPEFAEQKTGVPTTASTSYPYREKPRVFYEPELPDSHLAEQAQKGSAVPGFAEQKTGVPTAPSASYPHREKPSDFYEQELLDSHLAEQAQKVSPVSGSAYQKSRIPVALPSSYSHRGKPSVFYQQKWPDSRLTEQAQHISALPGPVDQYTQRQTLPSSYYSHRQNPIILYQQELSDSHLTDEALKVSAVPGPADQKTETPIGFSRPYSLGEKPSIVYQQALTDSTLTEESLKVSSAPRPGDQKTGILTVPTSSDPHREQRSIFYQQAFPSHLPTEALEVSVVPGPAEKKGGLQSEAFSVYYSCREKPSSVYQQELPDSHLTEQAQKVSAAPGPANQKAGISTLPSTSYLHTEEPFIFYPQGLPDSQLFEEALKASAVSGPVDQKTGLPPTVYSTHYSNREKHIIFSPQALPDSHLLEEALEDSAVSEPVDQKTGLSSEPSSSYTQREKPIIFYPHGLAGSHVPEEALKVAAVSRTGDQKTCLPTVPSSSYLLGGKPIIFCQQALPDRHLTEEALNVSASPGPTDQKTGIPRVSSISYSQREKPFIFYQQGLPDSQPSVEALKVSFVPEPGDQKTRKLAVTSAAYSHGEKPIVSYQQELPSSHLTQEALKVSGVTGPADQKTGLLAVTSASDSYREKPIISYQQEFPDPNEDALKLLGSADQKTSLRIVSLPSCSHGKSPIFPYQELPDLTEEALKPFALPEPADQKTEISTGPSSSHSQKQRLRISAVILPDDQKTELPAALCSSYSYKEKPKNLTVIGPDDQTTPLLTVLHNSYSQREKPSIFFQQQLPDRHQSEDTLKISTVPEPADLNSGIPIPLSSSYSHREKSNVFYTKELPDKHLTEDAVKVSAIPGPAAQKIVLPVAPPISSSHREKPNTFCQQDLSDRHLIEDSLMFPSGVGQDDQITRLSTVPSATYSHSEKYKLISDHVQRLIDNLGSSNTGIILNNVPLNSQANERVVINKPESSGFEDVSSEEVQDTDSNSKTLKEIRTLLMEAENRALKRCNFPSPLVPFRDVSDISFIQSKKVVCFKEPPTTNESNGDLSQSQPFTEESPSSKCMQNDTSTQTNLKCQTGIENWEFSSTTVSNPLQEAENKATVAFDETLRQYKAAKSVMRSEPEGYSGLIGNKIVIPVMTIIKSDSNSDTSSCSWDSNSFESVSDVLLNFFPSASPKTSMTGSREEEGVSESDDGGGSSVDSLAAHVKNLLKCESSLNHAKQILRNAEEEESRVQARAWNMKFNLAHKCGYSISELNDDDRRKVEEIKENLFGHGRTTDLSKALRSPQGIGCKPEAVCSHIIIESHEKGCFRTLSAEQQQLDSHPCVFRSAEPSEIIRQQSPSSWRTRHINLSKSLDLNNPCFKVWNSLHLQSHSPFQNFTTDDFRINQSPQMPFHEKMDPWLAESVEPACVPPEEMDCHASSQMLPPEPMKKFTTSITFSSHRHSKCFSDSSVLKVGVAEGSQCTGASVGVFNSHFTEEQNPPRDLKQKTSSPSSFKIISQSPDKSVTILAESNKQSQKLPVEHSHQEEKLLEKSYYKGSHSEPNTSANYSNFKEVHFSDNHTLMSMGRPSSTLEVKEKTVTVTPDLSSNIFLEQQELFEQSKSPHADHHVRKHRSPPPQHQDYVVPNLPCRIFLEKRELFGQTKASHVDHKMRENYSPFLQGQDYIASDLPSSIFLEQRQLLQQSKAPDVDHCMRKHHSLLPQGQDCIIERNNQNKHKPHVADTINVEAKSNNVVSQSAPNQCTVVTSASTTPSNRKALSCFHITLCPKIPSKLDSGTLHERFHSLDPASKTRMDSEFNSDLQTVSSRSLEPASNLLTSKPIAQDQESLGSLGLKSSLDLQVIQSSLPDSKTISQDLKTIPFRNSQIVTSRQTQVNISDLEGYSNPDGTPVSADRSSEKIKIPFSAFSGKLSFDAINQITTEGPEKTMFSSEIFINAEDHGGEIAEFGTQKVGKVPVKFGSLSSVQQITVSRGTDAQPSLLPYKPSGSSKMYYVPQLKQIPSTLDSKSDTTIESSHSGSNDAIAPDFPAQVLGLRDDDLEDTVNIKHKEGIYSKRAVTKASLSVGKKPFLQDSAGSKDAAAKEHSAQLENTKIESLPDTKAIKQKESHSKKAIPKEAWSEDKESLQTDIAESRRHSEFENTTHSVFRSAKFYIHRPVHLPSDQDFCHEFLGRSVFMRHSWKDLFQHHPDNQREHSCLPPSYQNVEKTKTDYTKIQSLSINVNLENKEEAKSQARDYPQSDKQLNDQNKDQKVTSEPPTRHTAHLNELWNKYQEQQKQQKKPEFGDRKELSLVERLDRLAKLLQNPITHSLLPSGRTQDDSRGERDVKEGSARLQQQKNKLQKKKRYKSLEKYHRNTRDLKKSKVFSAHQDWKSNQIKIEQIKFDKYILRKQPGFHYINTSSDSRQSEESELLTDTATNIISTTTSPVESDILTQTDKEVTLNDRSSSLSTIDTARLIQAFGHERVCLSPRQIRLYNSVTNHQRRYLEKRSKNKKAFYTCHPQMTSEHTRRKHIQVASHMISSDCISSSTSSFWNSNSTFCNNQNLHMLNKGVQAGHLEIVNGIRKHTRDVGMTFPTPSSSEARVEEDSDVTSSSEEKTEEKSLLTSYAGDKKLRKNKHSCCEGVSWFVPVENVKSVPKKENLPQCHGPGIAWFAPVTNTKPWREPLREQNWQGQHMDSRGSQAGHGRDPLKPFVRATLQESLQLHRPDFISRSGERIKRLKLIVQERKLQNVLQSEREALFNPVRAWPGCQEPMRPTPKRGFLAAQKNRPIGKKEMIQRSKRIYEQLPEVQKKREEEKRKSEYKSYRLRAQLYKKKVTNQLLGRKVPWD
ncbi:centrosome-associated protein ALMS1 isoform X3 [Manis pentadactyla]|uniref:centrosome-associated protein ALMS1 isoform X3 n=1 Tax=Manis pentadactyla TaxID=143292 RepID=UPI00255C8AB8|nr:centrosome-associated protein ALMS1 isoform X3 [Manis pentadactyla]